jgi:membrane protease YdiL (CAAX protease family)
MNKKQFIVFIIPPMLTAFMYPIFNSLAGALANDRIAWYLGLITYWLVWGMVFLLIIIGKKDIKALIRPQKPTKMVIIPMSIILLGALAARLFVPGMEYEKQSVWILLLLLSTSFGNGFFEEGLWRGVYFKLLPRSVFYIMPYSLLSGSQYGIMYQAPFYTII